MKTKQKFTIADCVMRHLQSPDTFEIPEPEEYEKIKEGDYVLIIFEDKERMWVLLDHADLDKDEFSGTLSNNPIVMKGLIEFGDRLYFNKRNIAKVVPKDKVRFQENK